MKKITRLFFAPIISILISLSSFSSFADESTNLMLSLNPVDSIYFSSRDIESYDVVESEDGKLRLELMTLSDRLGLGKNRMALYIFDKSKSPEQQYVYELNRLNSIPEDIELSSTEAGGYLLKFNADLIYVKSGRAYLNSEDVLIHIYYDNLKKSYKAKLL